MYPVPLLNLEAQYASLRSEILTCVQGVLDHQHFILGENVASLEREVAAFCGVGHAVGVASGTDALLLALRSAGVGPGDEVIVPAFSFVATADCVTLLGAKPVFADIDPVSFNLDCELLEEFASEKTRAIIPVHLYGQPAEMERIVAFARRRGIVVIGDTAQALGSRIGERSVCAMGDLSCISFFPSKNLGGCGDGGMVVTDSREHAERLRMLRAHGSRKKYVSEFQGYNSRLDELQAAILRVKLPHLDRWNTLRAHNAQHYTRLLAGTPDITLPAVSPGCTHVFHQYTVRVPERDRVQAELARKGIQTAVYYPVPLHRQPMFAALGYQQGSCQEAELACAQVLSLPIYPELTPEQIEYVAGALQEAVAAAEPALSDAR